MNIGRSSLKAPLVACFSGQDFLFIVTTPVHLRLKIPVPDII